MARISTAGMSVNDILNMDLKTFNQLDLGSMKAIMTRLNSAANKRIARLEKAGETSPALSSVQRSGGKFSVADKNLNQLRAEYARARNFMEMKTSSLSGLEKVEKETVSALQQQGVDVERKDLDNIFSVYEKLKEIDPSIANRRLKYEVLEEIAKLDADMSIDEKVDVMQSKLVGIYEEQAELEEEYAGFSDFFEIEEDI